MENRHTRIHVNLIQGLQFKLFTIHKLHKKKPLELKDSTNHGLDR